MRTGVCCKSLRVLTGWDHCVQSIITIVTTAIGSRVLARDFGCDAPALLDRPQTPRVIMDHFVAIARALRKWEPGFRLRKISVVHLGADGACAFDLQGDFYPNGHLGDYRTVVKMQMARAPWSLAA